MFGRMRQFDVGRVIEENLDYLVRFALFRVGDKEAAEDIVQEGALRLLEKANSIKPSAARLYLFRIVYNLCQDYHKAKRENLSLNSIDTADEEALLDEEEAKRINRMLETIPIREQEVIRMNVVDELSFAEISRILEVPVSTIKSRFRAGMSKLKTLYLKQ